MRRLFCSKTSTFIWKQGETTARAVFLASREVATPRLLAMLSVSAVFLPSFFHDRCRHIALPAAFVGSGIRDGYVVSALKHACACAFELAPAQVGRKSIMKKHGRFRSLPPALSLSSRTGDAISRSVAGWVMRLSRLSCLASWRRIYPGRSFLRLHLQQFRLRIDAPDGTRVAVTEDLVRRVLDAINDEAGARILILAWATLACRALLIRLIPSFFGRAGRSRQSSTLVSSRAAA